MATVAPYHSKIYDSKSLGVFFPAQFLAVAIDRSKKAMPIRQDLHLVPITSDISMTSSFLNKRTKVLTILGLKFGFKRRFRSLVKDV